MASLALPTITSPLVQYSRFSSTSFYSLGGWVSPGRSPSLCCAVLCCAVARAKLPSSASPAPWSAEGTASHADLDAPEPPSASQACCVRQDGAPGPTEPKPGHLQLHGSVPKGSSYTSAHSLNVVSDDIKGGIRRGWTECEGG